MEKTEIGHVDKPTYLGQWKRIPRKDFLLTLPKGKYLLQSRKIIRLNKAISQHYVPELSRSGSHKKHFSVAEQETEQELVDTVTELMDGINERINQLVGVPNGGDDPLLEEMYQSVDRLLAAGFDHYVKVRPDYFCESSRERMLIVVDSPHPGLLYNEEIIDEAVPIVDVELVAKSTNNEGGRLPTVADPKNMPVCSVKLKRLETFILEQQMELKWKLFWKSVEKKRRERSRKKGNLMKEKKLKKAG